MTREELLLALSQRKVSKDAINPTFYREEEAESSSFYGFRMVCWNTPHVTGSRSSNRSAYCRPRLRRHGREPGGMAILPCTTTATTAVSTTRERVCGSQAGEKNTTVADQVAVETVHSDPSLSLSNRSFFYKKVQPKKKKYLDLEITGNSTSFFDGSCNEFVTA